jgi:hypothetical protein
MEPRAPSRGAASVSRNVRWRAAPVIEGLRLFHCARCNRKVCVCTGCDRGQIYCPGECQGIRRRESVRRAGITYQRSPRGARKHAARQKRWRGKISDQKVTHHGLPGRAPAGMVATSAAPRASAAEEDGDGDVADDNPGRQGAETARDEPRWRRPAQGAPSSASAAPACVLTLLEGVALWSGEPLYVVISAASHRDDWMGCETWAEELWPTESPLVRFDFAIPPPRPRRSLRGVGDFRAVRRQLRLVWSR